MPKVGAMEVQAILFDKSKYTTTTARAWLKKHNYVARSMRITENLYRYRIVEPNKFNQKTFKLIHITDGVKAVVGKLL